MNAEPKEQSAPEEETAAGSWAEAISLSLREGDEDHSLELAGSDFLLGC